MTNIVYTAFCVLVNTFRLPDQITWGTTLRCEQAYGLTEHVYSLTTTLVIVTYIFRLTSWRLHLSRTNCTARNTLRSLSYNVSQWALCHLQTRRSDIGILHRGSTDSKDVITKRPTNWHWTHSANPRYIVTETTISTRLPPATRTLN